MDRAALGRKGEAVAALSYQKKGYQLLDHNYRTRMGEIDLILEKEDLLVFVEVKTRTDLSFARPAEAVDRHKQRRLILAAQQYLQRHPGAERQIRFDVAEVVPLGDRWTVHCIPNAFSL